MLNKESSFYPVFLYSVAVLCWGSTWIVITFQLGDVDPIVPVIYRFLLASIVLFAICLIMGWSLQASKNEHIGLAIQGIFLFGINYWVVYHSELYITSGLVAVTFSLLVFFNAINARIILKKPLSHGLLMAGVVGLFGMSMLFYDEVFAVELNRSSLKGFGLALLATFLASFGNIAAVRNESSSVGLIARTAWSMLYGSLVLVLITIYTQPSYVIPLNAKYIGSLIYLAVFGSVIAFTAYLKLISVMGADKAAYASMAIPVVAMFISTLFESYQWSPLALIGLCLILGGNYWVLRK